MKRPILRHQLAAATLKETVVYQTSVNLRTQNRTRAPFLIQGARDDELAIYQSAINVRVNSPLPQNRMPQLGSKEIDPEGVARLHK